MNRLIYVLIITFALSTVFVSCAKKPLTLDEQTSMKTLLKASDKELEELVIKEVQAKANTPAENIKVEYIMKDEEGQAIAVKVKLENQEE